MQRLNNFPKVTNLSVHKFGLLSSSFDPKWSTIYMMLNGSIQFFHKTLGFLYKLEFSYLKFYATFYCFIHPPKRILFPFVTFQ